MLITRRSMMAGVAGAAFLSVASSPVAEADVYNGHDVSDKILDLWLPNKSWVGLPLSDVMSVTGGKMQRFANADMYYSSAAGASIITGKIKTAYDGAKGPSALGLPIGVEAVSSTYSSRSQACLAGRIWYSSSDGAKAVPASKTVRLKGCLLYTSPSPRD